MRRLFLLFFAMALVPGIAWGQTTRTADHEELIKALLARIDQLERRVSELEGKQASAVVPPLAKAGETLGHEAGFHGAGPGTGESPQSKSAAEQATATHAQDTYPSLQIRGFADFDFSATDQPGTLSGFNLGQFVLHLASPLSRKVSYFGEISMSARPTGYAVEVERSVIRYDYNDHFKLSFGRYHTPVNYWNTAFHHGLWLQTTISRPEMIQFGGRFLPIHFIGLLAEGNIPSGGLGLGYNAGLGNGRASLISRAGDAGDSNNNRAWVLNLFARPARLHGLQVGGSVYGDKISPETGPNVRELISSAHIVWARETPEFLAEFANVHHRNIFTGQIFNSQAFYVQVAYRLPWNENHWKPYYRFEYIHSPASEPVLGVPNLAGSTLGIRYDISEYAAFKTEYRNTRRQAGQARVNGLFIQTSFTF
jgi:hypothetical protein